MRSPLREKETFSWYCSSRVGEREPEPQQRNGEQRAGSWAWGTEIGDRGPPQRSPVPGPPPSRPVRCHCRGRAYGAASGRARLLPPPPPPRPRGPKAARLKRMVRLAAELLLLLGLLLLTLHITVLRGGGGEPHAPTGAGNHSQRQVSAAPPPPPPSRVPRGRRGRPGNAGLAGLTGAGAVHLPRPPPPPPHASRACPDAEGSPARGLSPGAHGVSPAPLGFTRSGAAVAKAGLLRRRGSMPCGRRRGGSHACAHSGRRPARLGSLWGRRGMEAAVSGTACPTQGTPS